MTSGGVAGSPGEAPERTDTSRDPETSRQPESERQRERERQIAVDVDPRSMVWVFGGFVFLALLFALFRAASGTLVQIGLATVLALALDPVVGAIRRRFDCSRVAAVALIGVGLLSVGGLVVAFVGPRAVDQAGDFADELPTVVESTYDLPVVGERLRDADAAARVDEWARDLPARIDDEAVSDVIGSLVGGLVSWLTVAVVAVALLVDGESIVERARRVLPARRREQADAVGRVLYRVFGRYFSGSLFVAVLAGLFVLIVGTILQVPLTPVAALWMIIVDLIPQIGGFLGGLLFVGLALTKDVQTALVVFVVYVVYNTLENHVLQPAIVGESVNLSPPTTMLAAVMGGAAAGVPGALVATPIFGTVKILYLHLRRGTALEHVDDAAAPGGGESTAKSLVDRFVGRIRRRRS